MFRSFTSMALIVVVAVLTAADAKAEHLFLSPLVDGFVNRVGGMPCGTTPHEGDSLLIVKTWEAEGRSSRALLRFDFPTLPPGSQIGSAKLFLDALREINYFTDDFHVSRITESWSSSQANWCNRSVGNLWCTQGVCFTPAGQVTRSIPSKFGGLQGNYDEWIEWDVTEMVNDWLIDGQPNYA